MKKTGNPVETLVKEYMNDYNRWQYGVSNGIGDPYWPDGTNLNLLRNHLIYYLGELDELIQGQNMPILPELPPEMPAEYMAREEEILKEGVLTLEKYGQNEAYQYIKNHAKKLTFNQQNDIGVMNVLNYYNSLEEALKDKDLVVIRRHCVGQEGYIKSMTDCANEMNQIINVRGYQLTIMDILKESEEHEI